MATMSPCVARKKGGAVGGRFFWVVKGARHEDTVEARPGNARAAMGRRRGARTAPRFGHGPLAKAPTKQEREEYPGERRRAWAG